MKKIFLIIFILLNLVSQSYSGEIEELKNDFNVNKLMQNGWKIYSTNAISSSMVLYHLKKDQQLVTCSVNNKGIVSCWKP